MSAKEIDQIDDVKLNEIEELEEAIKMVLGVFYYLQNQHRILTGNKFFPKTN